MSPVPHTRCLILVEGESDEAALGVLARRLGAGLHGAGAEVVAIGGAHAIGRVLRDLPPGTRVAGLCDAGEAELFGRALAQGGIAAAGSSADLARAGFFTCDPDLEGELIRALGPAGVETVLDRSGKLGSFRTFQKQPQWRGRPVEDQLRRFFGSSAGKIRHAPLLAEAVELDRVPRPIVDLLVHVRALQAPRTAPRPPTPRPADRRAGG